MDIDMIQALLDLSENNDERNRIDPRKPLAILYREIKDLRSLISAAEKKLASLDAENQEREAELDQLILNKPKWVADIARAKDRMVRQRGLTLKDMLEIQQEVVRLEESVYYGESKIVDLRGKNVQYKKDRSRLTSKIRELKTDYNGRAEVYNREKAKADQLLGDFAAREDELLERIDPKARAAYREALRMNPDNPVVVLCREICNGCHIGLSKQLLKKINQGDQVIFCENCLRIILPEFPEND